MVISMRITKNPGDGKLMCCIDVSKADNLRLHIDSYNFASNEFQQFEERKLVSHMWSDHENLYLYELPSGLRGLYRICVSDGDGNLLKQIKRHFGEKIKLRCMTGRRSILDGVSERDMFVIVVESNMDISGDCVYYKIDGNDLRYYIPGDIKTGRNEYALKKTPADISFYSDESVEVSIDII